jgi:hypothetical protein
MYDLSILYTRCNVALDGLFTRVRKEHPEVLEPWPLRLSSFHEQHRTGYPSGSPCPSFATTTGEMLACRPPVAPSVAAPKHTSARIETCFNATTTDIYNP